MFIIVLAKVPVVTPKEASKDFLISHARERSVFRYIKEGFSIACG